MFRSLRTITAAAGLALTLTACSPSDDDPVAGVPAFPIDAPSVTLLNPGDNPQEVRYFPDGEWDTTVAVSAGVDQHVAKSGDSTATEAPAGGDVDTTTLPLAAESTEAPAPEDGPVLDLGCGYGPVALALAARSPDTEFICTALLAPEPPCSNSRKARTKNNADRTVIRILNIACISSPCRPASSGSTSAEGSRCNAAMTLTFRPRAETCFRPSSLR